MLGGRDSGLVCLYMKDGLTDKIAYYLKELTSSRSGSLSLVSKAP